MKSFIIFCASFLVFTTHTAFGQVPQTMSYQGMLTNAEGIVVADGQYTLTFKLYDAAAGGQVVWAETQKVSGQGGSV